MGDMRQESFDFVSSGWLRYLPEPALVAYGRLWSIAVRDEVAGDLDELGAEALDVAVFGGLDASYNPAAHGDADMGHDEEPTWAGRWAEFGEQAAKRGMPMRTSRDAIEFMCAIGLVEHVERDGEAFWQPVVPVPLAEDLLDLDEEAREREAKLRWHTAFQQASNRVIGWLVDQRTDARTTGVAITLTELAGRVELDVDETRHGLVATMEEAGDVTVTPHPEAAEPDQPLRIVVDWTRFDAERIAIHFGAPDDE